MKDFFEHERKMRKLIAQVQSPIPRAQKLIEQTSTHRIMNSPVSAVNSTLQNSMIKNILVSSSLKSYCLPNSLMGVTSSLEKLSGSLAMLATGTKSVLAAESAMNVFLRQQQRLAETVERFGL